MRISILLSSMLLPVVLSAQTGESVDSLSQSKQLNEVVVHGKTIINKGDCQVLLLSKRDRNFGNNALNALSSHPMFRTELNGSGLSTFDGQDVFILINGVPADGYELRSYSAKDIKSVEYYQVAPAQYAIYTSGPVANILLKRKHDRLYTGYFDASNAVNTGFGTNQADLTYRDSLNQVKVGYQLNYRDISNLQTRSFYDYGSMRTDYNGKSKYNGEYQNLSSSYQRFQGKHLFNAKIGFVLEPNKQIDKTKAVVTEGGTVLEGENGNVLESSNKRLTADLYYRYQLGRKRYLAFNVVNSFGKSSSDSRIWQQIPAPFDNLDYDVMSSTRNKTYSLIVNALFTSTLWGGNLSVGSKYEYTKLTRKYSGEESTPVDHMNVTYLGYTKRFNGFAIAPLVGVKITNQQTGTRNETNLNPHIQLNADWQPKNVNGMSIQLMARSIYITPTLSELAGSTAYLDRNFIATGNPNLVPFFNNYAKLTCLYFDSNGKYNIAFIMSPRYCNRQYVSVLARNGETMYLQPQNVDNVFKNEFRLMGTWNPFTWLEVTPYFEYYTNRYDTPNRKVRDDYFRCGGWVVLRYKNFESTLAYNMPDEDYDGDILTHSSTQWAIVAQYKYRNFSFGASLNYSGMNNYTEGKAADFSYKERTDWKPLRNLAKINVTYTFAIGKARKHDRKSLNNESTETGLTKNNKPQMPN